MKIINKNLIKIIQNDYNLLCIDLFNKELLRDSNNLSILEDSREIATVSWSGKNSSCSNISFNEELSAGKINESLSKTRQFSFLMYDKAVVQFEMIIENGMIVRQRFLFVKKHNILWGKEEIQEYESDQLGNAFDWFEEEIGIPIMLRLDYDPKCHVDVDHPKSHFVISNVKDCRVPVSGPMEISRFMDFILRCFYNQSCDVRSFFDKDISINEKEIIHLNWD